MTFSSFDHHSSQLEIIKFPDLVTFVIATFMYKFHNQLLPSVFQSFFTRLDTVHSYHIMHSAKQSYYLPKARTNYGKFNIRFQGPKIWNAIDYDIKHLPISSFKIKLKQNFLQSYQLIHLSLFLQRLSIIFSDILHYSVQLYFFI